MEISQDFIENALFGEYMYDWFRKDGFEQGFFDECHKMAMVEYDYEDRMIRVIKGIKSHRYEETRNAVPFDKNSVLAEELFQMRCVIKSLLKGIIATSSIVYLSEIKGARIRWNRYNDRQDRYDPQGHHNQVYREFKKVENLEELERFNDYFHNYILDLVFGLAEIYIRRLRYTIEHFEENATFEDACIKGNIKLKKFKFDLEEIKTFTPEPPGNDPPENKPEPTGQGSETQPDPLKNEPEIEITENRTPKKSGPVCGCLWAFLLMLFISGFVTLVTVLFAG